MTGRPLAAYVTVTAAYWAFMLTDGALRMLVLLHFHQQGMEPVRLAMLFALYEVAGMVTNLGAGWLAARFGLTTTLYLGLGLQVAALLALAQLDPAWTLAASTAFVMAAQGASGVAKDLTKMSSKSAVKLLAPEAGGALFRWVAALTGSKNAVKGAGFFLGGALLGSLGFTGTLWLMAAALAVILGAILLLMPPGLPAGRKGAKFSEVFSTDPAVNWLSAARLFLFGARDVWFVVGVPVFLHDALGRQGMDADTAFFAVGGFMAVWIVFYGAVQASAPRLLRARDAPRDEITRRAADWARGVVAIPALLAVAATMLSGVPLLIAVIGGLLVFAAVFALNSALHSYLILALTRGDRVTLDVGFYYMSNAAGRLLGTLLSGLSYQVGGLPLCLAVASAMAAASWAFATALTRRMAAA